MWRKCPPWMPWNAWACALPTSSGLSSTCLGVAPHASLCEAANPPDENCGICHYKLAEGDRCGGGTHFVCMGCIEAYKTTYYN